MGLPVVLADFAGALPAPGDSVVVDGPEGRHAVASRRTQPGDTVYLTDGEDRRVLATVSAVEGKSSLVAQVRSAELVERPFPHVTVVQALPKSERSELAVDLAVEAGADAIVPWSARNCIAKWTGPKAGKGREKWAATSRETAKQARRSWIPPVAELHSTSQVADLIASADGAMVLHEAATDSFETVLRGFGEPKNLIFIVGPEGGVSDEEIEIFTAAGARPVVLGPTVLRTSAAAAVALGALGPLTGRWA